jgi:hypothetical protein
VIFNSANQESFDIVFTSDSTEIRPNPLFRILSESEAHDFSY